MTFLQWRRFAFFEKELVKDPETNQVFDKLQNIHITCSTSGRGSVVLGDVEGNIHFLNRQFQLSSFQAFELNVSHIQQLRHNAVLVSVGTDEPGINPLIKIWNLEKTDRSGKPTCMRNIRVQVGAQVGVSLVPVTALSVHENLNLMAIGLDKGNVLMFKGDITRERQCKQKLISVGTGSVTGLAFRNLGKMIFLYTTTLNEVHAINLTSKDKDVTNILDNHGCPPKCSVMSDSKQDYQFVVGRNDAAYFYQPDGRGPCFAFEGEKVILHWFRGNLVVVGKDTKVSTQPSMPGSPVDMRCIVTVYDIQNKFIAYSAPFSGIIDIVSEWGTLFIISQDGKLYSLQEKDTQSKLEMLFKKNQYSLAISLAKSQQYDDEGLVDIFRQYGDHLYSKGDHDGAINQYIKTIGKLEASYVIRKFLDAQRIHNLTAYLQALHKKGLATEDHTTLLLNCYTKLDDKHKLNEFIMTKDREIDFDIEIAIKVCRQAGFYKHALFLAENYGQHDWYLKIQLEDQKDYSKALDYIAKLEFSKAEDNMKKYGKILINKASEQTTDLLKNLCTDFNPGNSSVIQRAQPEEFIHIFVNNSAKLLEFLEHMVKVRPASSALVYNTLLELYLQSWNHETDDDCKEVKEEKIMTLLTNSEAKFDVDQALVLCQMNTFKPGVLHLYEKTKLFQQILLYHMEHKDHKSIIQTCERFGTCDPNLWVQALWYFSQLENENSFLSIVLNQIKKSKLLPPIMVVDIMAQSKTAKLSVIKDYLTHHLQNEYHRIAEDERLIRQYREETEKMRNQIEDLKTNAKIFQVSKCSGCTHQLELPSVHFFCGHSYHQQCFESYSAENDSECPLCVHENRKVLDIIHSQEQSKDLHEQFHHQLERAEDGFSVVADYFGRGVFNTVTLITDSSYNNSPVSKSMAM